MRKKFTRQIPRRPVLKRQTYSIPSSYENAYGEAGIKNPDEQAMLFHATQFGGFRLRKIPKNMHFEDKFIEKWFRHEYDAGYHHFRASADFLSVFGNLEIKPLQINWKLAVLNPKDMTESGFSEEEISDSVKFLSELNAFYSSMRLEIPFPQSGITAEDRIQLSKFQGIPYLVKKPKAGGRFFHPGVSYQRISVSLRQMMALNGQKTSEVDLTAATLQFLNIALEKYAPLFAFGNILSNGDPYNYFLSSLNSDDVLLQHREQKIGRDEIKNVIYTVVYSSKEDQENNVNRKLRLMGRNYKHSDFIGLFPEFFNGISMLHSQFESLPLHMIIFKEESRYAQKVLQRGCLEKMLPILPLHDSFLTTAENTEALKEVMDSASEEMYGRRLAYKRKY